MLEKGCLLKMENVPLLSGISGVLQEAWSMNMEDSVKDSLDVKIHVGQFLLL